MKRKPKESKAVVTAAKTKELPLRTIHESVFWEEDDPRRRLTNNMGHGDLDLSGSYGGGRGLGRVEHVVDMRADSYIWVFTGSRGAGKTTLMTLMAMKVNWLYGYRIVSNYPIEYILVTKDGKSRHVKSEELDLYKMLCFEDDYKDCLIVMDEAPDIVSHMAAQTWKNRLINIFVRQLRKNHNSLFMGAQQFELVDKSLRWQCDIEAECADASRKYGWGAEYRGETIFMKLYDNSGMWTGENREQKYARLNRSRAYEPLEVSKMACYPRLLWADNGCKPVFDSYRVMEVWESLRRVDMKLSTYEVGDRQHKNEDPATMPFIQKAAPVITQYMAMQAEDTDRVGFYSKAFYAEVGSLTTKEKDALSKRMNDCGLKIGQDTSNGKRYYDYRDFDFKRFIGT